MVRLMSSNDVDCQRSAAMAICNLATDPLSRQHLVQNGGLRPLIRLLLSPSVDAQKYAAMALCNLATNGDNQVAIVRLGGLSR